MSNDQQITGESVLIVEDDPIVRDVVIRYLIENGFRPIEASSGLEGQRRFESEAPDLVVLDLMLPGMDGLSLCRWIRRSSATPIIMLTAKGEEADRIVGLELGADDYLTKPFSPRELIARIRAVLRRGVAPRSEPESLVFDDLRIDPQTREVRSRGELVRLTAREFDLLFLFASHPRQVFTRDQIMDRIWGFTSATDTGTVTVHTRRLREKIEQDPSKPRHLETVWGVGYRFVP
ncbi:MAG: response regulator [Actinomycetota bacterium]